MYGLWSCFHISTCSVTHHLVVHHELNTRERPDQQELGSTVQNILRALPLPQENTNPGVCLHSPMIVVVLSISQSLRTRFQGPLC
jgi:hypothetical protein